MGRIQRQGDQMSKRMRSDKAVSSTEAGGASLLLPGEAGRQVAVRVARVTMGLDPITGDQHFYRASDGTLGLIVDEPSFHALNR